MLSYQKINIIHLLMMENCIKLLDLYSKPKSEQFTEEEKAYIRSKESKNSFECIYAFYNKKSSKGCYIAFIIDSMPNTRRSLVMNNWNIICKRKISDLEYEEQIENFGCNHRRFAVYYYREIEHLIEEDKLYGVSTPEEFVTQCKKKGYVRKLPNQLKLDL